MNELRQELLAAFAVEHQEHLQAIREALAAALAGLPFDLRDIFRRAHSLKGAARAVDLPAVEEMAHRLEAIFSRVSEDRLQLNPATIAAVQVGLDGIEGYVAALDEGTPPPAPSAVLVALDRVLEGEGTPPPSPPPSADIPALSEAPAAPPEPKGAAAVEYLRVNAEQVEELGSAAHALSEALARQSALEAELRALEGEIRALRRGWETLGLDRGQPSPGRSREFERGLNQLFRHVTRLGRDQRGATWAATAAAATLRRRVERISLVPAETVLGSLGRMARDLAREAGREAAVRMEGLDLQADRRVLQALKDPVTHLLRNAVSHGLDSPANRAARGKPAEAEIGLRLEARGGLLVLTVFDDGGGPDLRRIEEVAIQRGLLSPRGTDQPPPPPDRLLSLVFEPGFSTNAEVDRLSGRGIGLSVVAEAARRLRGAASMRQRQPHGTEIEIVVPFSAARQPVLLVTAGSQLYGLPSRGVERLLRLPAASIQAVERQAVTRIEIGGRGVIVPVIALTALLGRDSAPLPAENGHVHAVLLRAGERRCALAVEALHDVRTLRVEALDAPGAEPDLLGGAALIEGSAPALVLSPEGLVGRWLRDEGRLAATGLGLAPAQERSRQATILVVDDSITTRTLEKSILEAQGFRVLLSVDGLDALNRLRSGEALVDLIVADVEMPRMDGFALLQALKNDPRLAPIPVILMTSRANPEDVRRGLDLGAGAYITKQKFDQRELLATIGQML